MKVGLVETVLPGNVSMHQYADTLEHSLHTIPGGVPYSVERIRLSLPAWTQRLRGKVRTAMTCISFSRQASQALRASGADLHHILDGSQAYLGRWSPTAATATVHDLIPLLQARGALGGDTPGAPARWLIRMNAFQLKQMPWLMADSENTRVDLTRTAGIPPARVTVVHCSLPSHFSEGLSEEKPAVAREPFILHVGNNAFYKNRSGVVRIFSLVRREKEVRLVMAGPAPTPALRSLIRKMDLGHAIQFVLDPNQDEIVRLYERASLLLFPSLYEGFGWPPLEAMSCGCPVVASNRASLPEVVGEAGLLGNPDDLQRMAGLCLSVFSNPGLAHSLAENGRARVRHFTPLAMGVTADSFFRQALGMPVTGTRSA